VTEQCVTYNTELYHSMQTTNGT